MELDIFDIDVGCGFEFLKCLWRLSIEINIFPPVNANTSWLIMLVA
jgi:hypothetical protein